MARLSCVPLQHRWSLSNCPPKSMRRSSSADMLAPAQRRATDGGGAAERMIDNFARRERERRASFSEIKSWEGLQARPEPDFEHGQSVGSTGF